MKHTLNKLSAEMLEAPVTFFINSIFIQRGKYVEAFELMYDFDNKNKYFSAKVCLP